MIVPSAPLRVGIVGLGEALADPSRSVISGMVADGRIRLVAGSDPSEEARAAAAEAFGLDAPQTAGDAVVASDVDVVLLLGRGDDRPRLAIDAFGHGLDVIVDGPLASSLETASRVAEAARASGRRLHCSPFLLDDTFRRVSELVTDGAIGTILTARAAAAAPPGAAHMDRGLSAPADRIFDACGPAVAALLRLVGPIHAVTALGRAADPGLLAADGRGATPPPSLQIGLDFGSGVLGIVTVAPPGSALRTPSLEVFGSEGTIQVDGRLGRDGGFDLWLNAVGAWELVPGDGVPADSATAALGAMLDGARSGVPILDASVARDTLEVALLAADAAADGRARATTASARRSSAAGILQ